MVFKEAPSSSLTIIVIIENQKVEEMRAGNLTIMKLVRLVAVLSINVPVVEAIATQ